MLVAVVATNTYCAAQVLCMRTWRHVKHQYLRARTNCCETATSNARSHQVDRLLVVSSKQQRRKAVRVPGKEGAYGALDAVGGRGHRGRAALRARDRPGAAVRCAHASAPVQAGCALRPRPGHLCNAVMVRAEACCCRSPSSGLCVEASCVGVQGCA